MISDFWDSNLFRHNYSVATYFPSTCHRSRFPIEVNDHSLNVNFYTMCYHKVKSKYYINIHLGYDCIYSIIGVISVKTDSCFAHCIHLISRGRHYVTIKLSSGFVSLIVLHTLVETNFSVAPVSIKQSTT